MSSELYDPLRTMAKITREVIVGFSTGKDSCVTLDLCFRFFDRVVPFFMYYVPEMSFQERVLNFYEKKYNISIERLPHFELGSLMRYGMYRAPDYDVPVISAKDVYDYMRGRTGITWVCCGERIADSTIRRAMIKRTGSIDKGRGRFFPLAYWKKRDVMEYLRLKKLPLGEDSRVFGHSWGQFDGETLLTVKKRWPHDYERIKRLFPLCEMAIRRLDYGSQQIPKL